MNQKLSALLIANCALLCGCTSDDPDRIACRALSDRQRLVDQHTWASNRPDNSRFDCDEYLARLKSR